MQRKLLTYDESPYARADKAYREGDDGTLLRMMLQVSEQSIPDSWIQRLQVIAQGGRMGRQARDVLRTLGYVSR